MAREKRVSRRPPEPIDCQGSSGPPRNLRLEEDTTSNRIVASYPLERVPRDQRPGNGPLSPVQWPTSWPQHLTLFVNLIGDPKKFRIKTHQKFQAIQFFNSNIRGLWWEKLYTELLKLWSEGLKSWEIEGSNNRNIYVFSLFLIFCQILTGLGV